MSGCDDCTRATQLRRAVAGQGLPAIEPGMPRPAGTGMTRRSLLLGGAGLALTVFGGRLLAPEAFADGVAAAAAAPDAPVIVSVFFGGGVDGIALLPPVTDPRYKPSLRPSLWVDPAKALPMSGTADLRWHPAAADFKDLHDRGRLTVFPAIGYEHANGSHFTSRHYYEVGATDPDGATGWLGRWLDLVGDEHNPVQGFTVGSTLSPALATARVAVAAAEAPEAYDFTTVGIDGGPYKNAMVKGFEALGRLTSEDPVLGPARAVHRDAADLRTTLSAPLPGGSVVYPDNPLAKRLRTGARLLGAGLPIRCLAVDAHGDFDSHAGQGDVFDEQLPQVGAALRAFQADLEQRGIADRVLTVIWSEFGRRPEENGSAGTDHGAGGVGFVMGTRVRGGLQGEFTGLARLDEEGNLLHSTDFRALYASVLEQWVGADAEQLIPGAARLPRYALLS